MNRAAQSSPAVIARSLIARVRGSMDLPPNVGAVTDGAGAACQVVVMLSRSTRTILWPLGRPEERGGQYQRVAEEPVKPHG